ncbi:biotin-dependent carboxyltransferase family protein [Natrarchaeobius sp. A-rgal3]|uniref:5-oxoprolinase subunit C family protein n=1 Tax=Natrarchaeobius versutus TaxID=1679078 RepID=UPI00351023C0
MSLEIVGPGLSTTVQDDGRFGHYHIGMPPSGAMDGFSHAVANYLVGNDETAATLEMTYNGADVRFEADTTIAIAGAGMSPELDGEAIPSWESVAVEAGQLLTTSFAENGVRSYLAVAGGVDTEPRMGSRSTYELIGLGGHEGRSLQEGDVLPIGDADNEVRAGRSVPDADVPAYDDGKTLRVIMGLCEYRLTEESKAEFLSAEWTVTPEADRIGCRFDGPDIEFVEREQPFGAGTDPSNVVDVGYPVGSIQVPEQPIVLTNDAVTGGGYATIGTVISPDRDLLAQCRTHESVGFESVSIEAALEARETHQQTLERIRDSL